MSETLRKGRCLCGAVRFETSGEPRFVANCHCESCRRAASAPSFVWAGFLDPQVAITGDSLATYASSPGVTRGFCGRCGSPLFYRSDKYAGETHLAACAFENSAELAPKMDYLQEEKLPWAALLAIT
jgi:hypothetical protein